MAVDGVAVGVNEGAVVDGNTVGEADGPHEGR